MTDTSTKTATDMFIPPPGAMQFEVTQGPNAINQKHPHPFVVWVAAPIDLKVHVSGCSCVTGFPILQMPTHPIIGRTNWKRGLRERVPVMVCTCFGRIIE